mgnify:CR=1 FL=1
MANDRITAAGWKIVLLASLGGTLEFYDFVIFGVFARDIAQAVFPASDPIVGLVLSFATFAVDYHLWGLDPRGFHVTSLLIHIACSLLVSGAAGCADIAQDEDLVEVDDTGPAEGDGRANATRGTGDQSGLVCRGFKRHGSSLQKCKGVSQRGWVEQGMRLQIG